MTPEERQHIADGGSIYLAILTFNQPLQPVLLATEVPEMFAAAQPVDEWADVIGGK